MVGHIFGYEAALAIDAQARPLREARARRRGRHAAGRDGALVLDELAPALEIGRRPGPGRLAGGCLRRPPQRLHRVPAHRPCCATPPGRCPWRATRPRWARSVPRPPSRADLDRRPRCRHRRTDPPHRCHKAPGQDGHRRDFAERRTPCFEPRWWPRRLAVGATVESLGYRALRTLAALGPAVEEVLGYTRYEVATAAVPVTAGRGSLDGATIRRRGPGRDRHRGYRPAPRPTTPCGAPSTAPPRRGRSRCSKAFTTAAPVSSSPR